MRVLLLKDVKGLGRAGEIKDVAGGHAQNYLFPNKLARPVTEGAVKQVQHTKEVILSKQERKAAEAKTLAARLDGQTITFKARSGEGERLYGSITNADIAEALSKTIGQPVDRKLVEIPHPIKTLGQHRATVKVGPGLVANVFIFVDRATEGA